MNYLRFSSVLLLSTLVVGCPRSPCFDPTFGEPEGPTLMEWVEHDLHRGEDPAPPPLDDLILYLDASLSMQGYPDPSGESEYSLALAAVRSVVDVLEPRHSILYRRVAEEVGPLEVSDRTLAEASTSSSFYTGGESDLGGAIRRLDQPEASGKRDQGVARCHILITDGVQHLGSRRKTEVCASGNDPRCVNTAVRRLIRDGWGVHLFGIRSRFDGPIFSEVDQEWLEGSYRARGSDETNRYRPFLIYLFTNNSDYMPQLVSRFRKELRRTGIRDELIGELPLTLRLVEATDLEIQSDVYKIVDEFGAELENPVVRHREPAWREDSDGRLLADNVEIFEYWGGDELAPPPFAFHVTANVEFTEEGRALFSRERADVGSLLRPVRVSQVPRPEAWYADRPAGATGGAGTKKASSLQGTGILADAGKTDEEAGEANGPARGADTQAVEERPAGEGVDSWPPPAGIKRLQFSDRLTTELKPPFELTEQVGCTLNGGCHLLARWSQAGECFPVSLVRLEADLDPEVIPLPSWISEWSTPSDTRLADANKILNLDRLVRGLLENEQIERQGLDPWYLVLWPTKSE